MTFNEYKELLEKNAHDLGWHDHNMSRNREFDGQLHTSTGLRGATEIKGITFRDLRDCFIRAFILSHCHYKDGTVEEMQPNASLRDEASKGEFAAICENDVYSLVGSIDPIAVAQNLSCEIEKIMGIYPNVPELLKDKNKPSL